MGVGLATPPPSVGTHRCSTTVAVPRPCRYPATLLLLVILILGLISPPPVVNGGRPPPWVTTIKAVARGGASSTGQKQQDQHQPLPKKKKKKQTKKPRSKRPASSSPSPPPSPPPPPSSSSPSSSSSLPPSPSPSETDCISTSTTSTAIDTRRKTSVGKEEVGERGEGMGKEPRRRPQVKQDGVFTVTQGFTFFCEDLQDEDRGAFMEGSGAHPSLALRYGVVAILGCQSSGKSTLLNEVFGTDFPVLDVSATGITRTTQGVWIDMENPLDDDRETVTDGEGHRDHLPPSSGLLARLKAKSRDVPVVVLDTEGLDSAARGESSAAFDSRLAGMVVSAADVIILNLWTSDVQRRGSGAGHEAVFRALAHHKNGNHKSKRHVVVVLRDLEMDGKGMVEETSKLLTSDLTKAWMAAGRDATEGLQAVELTVVGLPHYRYKARGFRRGVKGLRRLFRDSASEQYLFRELSEGQVAQPVGLPEFPRFVKDLWVSLSGGEGVEGHEGLGAMGEDYEGEAERIRSFILQRIVDSCCEEAKKSVARLRSKVESAGDMPILEFGADCQTLMDRALLALRDRASRVRTGVTLSRRALQAKEEEVLAVLGREVEPLFRAHIEALRQFYHGKFQDNLAGLYLPVKDFDKEASRLAQDICLTFSKAAQAAVPPQVAGQWDITGPMEQLKEDIDEEVADRRLEMEVAFPPEMEPPARLFRLKWWRSVAIKALVLYFNYLQSAQSGRAMRRAAQRRQENYPPFPLF